MMSLRTLFFAMVCVQFAWAQDPVQAPAATPPVTLLWDAEHLAGVRNSWKNGEEAYKESIQRVLHRANSYLGREPFTVTAKPVGKIAASADIHDYHSNALYWWPNPDSEDGFPYVRRDGEPNPDSYIDARLMFSLIAAVRDLGLAYYLSADERYADQATLFLETWFLNEATRMNPNLRYAQAIPGVHDGAPSGIIDTWSFGDLLEGVLLLQGSASWTSEKHLGLKEWFSSYLGWLMNTDFGHRERDTQNNHATWYLAQVGTYALFTGEQEAVREFYQLRLKRLAEAQLLEDGSQPYEQWRTLPILYSIFNLMAWADTLSIARKLEVADAARGSVVDQRVWKAVAYLQEQTAQNHSSDERNDREYRSASLLNGRLAALWSSPADQTDTASEVFVPIPGPKIPYILLVYPQ